MNKQCSHILELKIATDWTKTKVVPVPNCLRCGDKNKAYDDSDEQNKFYRNNWNLEYNPKNDNLVIGDLVAIVDTQPTLYGIVSFFGLTDDNHSEQWLEIMALNGTRGPFYFRSCCRSNLSEVDPSVFDEIKAKFVSLRLRQLLSVSEELASGNFDKSNLDFIAETKRALCLLGISMN